jgi:predicted Zn-dependent protease
MTRTALAEAHRAKRTLRAPGHRGPYFISYLVRDVDHFVAEARLGALHGVERKRYREAFADVRVGSYRSDHVQDGGLSDNDPKAESTSLTTLPIGDDGDALRHALWRLTECRYREAVEDLLEKEADSLHYRDLSSSLPAFERGKAVRYDGPKRFHEIDERALGAYIAKISAAGRRYGDVYACNAVLEVRHVTRVFVSTERAQVIERHAYWQLSCGIDLEGPGGIQVPYTISHFVADPRELPDVATMRRAIDRGVALMRRVGAAPTVRAYGGPVWLDPKPAGLIIHEAIGHRLEGDRLLSSGEGQTFRDFLGEPLLPAFLTLRDDPRLRRFRGRSLVGHFLYDDQGVPAEEASLIERGVLRGFMTSRAGIRSRHRSNGHARNRGYERPMSRMGVTVLAAEGGLSDAEMKKRLIDEVKARGLPFGIHVIDAEGGETTTKSYDFQAFLGQIRVATRIFPDGREELIRGVDFVGTPLNAMRGIKAATARTELDNAHCGAESGWVPVSTISPGLLIGDLELQADGKPPASPFTYPMPRPRR